MVFLTESFYDFTLTAQLGATDTTASVTNIPDSVTSGYFTMEEGTALEEIIKFTGVSGLTLTGLLRGLSNTLIDTEVAGNKKAHNAGAIGKMAVNHIHLNRKAEDDEVVHDTGNETVAGVKTFSSFPITPSSSPTTAYQVANKQYADGLAIAGAPDSSTTTKGITKMSTAPVSATDPIAVGDNDTRMLTGAQKSALTGGTTTLADAYHTHNIDFSNTPLTTSGAVTSGNLAYMTNAGLITETATEQFLGVFDESAGSGSPANIIFQGLVSKTGIARKMGEVSAFTNLNDNGDPATRNDVDTAANTSGQLFTTGASQTKITRVDFNVCSRTNQDVANDLVLTIKASVGGATVAGPYTISTLQLGANNVVAGNTRLSRASFNELDVTVTPATQYYLQLTCTGTNTSTPKIVGTGSILSGLPEAFTLLYGVWENASMGGPAYLDTTNKKFSNTPFPSATAYLGSQVGGYIIDANNVLLVPNRSFPEVPIKVATFAPAMTCVGGAASAGLRRVTYVETDLAGTTSSRIKGWSFQGTLARSGVAAETYDILPTAPSIGLYHKNIATGLGGGADPLMQEFSSGFTAYRPDATFSFTTGTITYSMEHRLVSTSTGSKIVSKLQYVDTGAITSNTISLSGKLILYV